MFHRLAPATLILLLSLEPACGSPQGGTDSTTGGSTGGSSSSTTGEPGDPDEFPGLSAPVEIRIDTRGIPHIYAQTDLDLFHAAGYQVATDRLFQMDLLRRRAYGRGAEVLGAGKVDEDKLSRIFNFARWGQMDAERLRSESPDDFRLFSAWVAGVNRRIDEIAAGSAPLPYGFAELGYMPERWDNVDPQVIGKMVSFGNSNVIEYELLATVVARLTPELLDVVQLPRPGWATFTVPPEDRPSSGGAPAPAAPTKLSAGKGAKGHVAVDSARAADAAAGLRRLHAALAGFRVLGSNNWSVDGRFTADGRPMIANDPHQPLESPSVMYALHLNSADAGGIVDIAGFGFAGVPGVQLGHNRKVHWAATTGFADCMDLYAVRIDPDETAIQIGGESAPIAWRDEVIKVAGAGDAKLRVGDVDGRGVLIVDGLPIDPALVVDADRRLLVNWTGFRATNEARAFLGMGRSGSIDEWERAVDLIEVGTFNWMAADASGITYHLNTQVPDRGDPAARPVPVTVVDGDDPGYVWSGAMLPPEKLPRSRAAQTGFIVTANNDPFGFTADGDLSNDPWYYGAYYDPGYRAGRIEQRLQQKTAAGGMTAADMMEIQTDTRSLVAEQILPVLTAAYQRVDVDDALAEFRDRPELETLHTLMTSQWSRRMERDQAGALAFHAFAHFLVTEIFADDLSLVFGPVLEASPVYALKFASLALRDEYPNSAGVMQEGRDLLVMRALSRTAGWLTAEFGSVDPATYTWGDRHGTGFRNALGMQLDGGWHPTDGGEDSVNVSGSHFYVSGSTTEVVPQFESNDGPVFRVVTRFAADGTPEALVNFPRGNSAEPGSPHFGDTLHDWIEDRYTHYPFRRHEVVEATETVVMLEP